MTSANATPGRVAGQPRGAAGGPEAARSRPGSWADRAAERSPAVQRSRARSEQQVRSILDAARRLTTAKGTAFTTSDLTKESGVALQTIYRHFAGKDQILLAVVEELIAEQAERAEELARHLPDPVSRLRYYVIGTLDSLRHATNLTGAQFMVAEHWRLHQLFPDEIAAANEPYARLVAAELREAAEQGLLSPRNPDWDAWFVIKLVMSTYHHYAFATADEQVEDILEHLWGFCLQAFGGRVEDHSTVDFSGLLEQFRAPEFKGMREVEQR
ncbi:TetR/AcrR family transcriptional regulator [Yinghuangia sp. ASG 101]|uniref:TetR/AcrR family transcriptional regulator n=1 Tax=Yinghuangia sp. ASG 101 TaxID=2896848 RepID=UPI001E28899B|nr:TetR/AcrR family transcriptional regulator [Yinghuangia sp. ASG 101]UGQ12705.1 TetR/AcrR family transcriptional regulator [Yinghuangia sp. ASG 101]